jgi:hypothetical protein
MENFGTEVIAPNRAQCRQRRIVRHHNDGATQLAGIRPAGLGIGHPRRVMTVVVIDAPHSSSSQGRNRSTVIKESRQIYNQGTKLRMGLDAKRFGRGR